MFARALGRLLVLFGAALVLYLAVVIVNGTVAAVSGSAAKSRAAAASPSSRVLARGRQVFRFDSFGDQAFWGGALQLHRAIAGSKNGGVGPGVSPKTALSVGLKVDATRIPKNVASAIRAGKVDLNDPKVTLTLLKLNAVVGVRGFFRGNRLSSMGLTCAVCHSTVDNSFAPGIGRRRDGWPNRDLNVGAIISLAPNKKPITDLLKVDEATVDKVLGIEARKLPDLRLHVRAIIRDGSAAFIGSQSLRKLELDGRREIGVIVSDERVVEKMRDVFEADWALTPEAKQAAAAADKDKEKEKEKEKEKATSGA